MMKRTLLMGLAFATSCMSGYAATDEGAVTYWLDFRGGFTDGHSVESPQVVASRKVGDMVEMRPYSTFFSPCTGEKWTEKDKGLVLALWPKIKDDMFQSAVTECLSEDELGDLFRRMEAYSKDRAAAYRHALCGRDVDINDLLIKVKLSFATLIKAHCSLLLCLAQMSDEALEEQTGGAVDLDPRHCYAFLDWSLGYATGGIGESVGFARQLKKGEEFSTVFDALVKAVGIRVVTGMPMIWNESEDAALDAVRDEFAAQWQASQKEGEAS